MLLPCSNSYLKKENSDNVKVFSGFSHFRLVFIYSRNINLKIYKNEKIVNRSKTDQIQVK